MKISLSARGATPSIAEKISKRARELEAEGREILYLNVGQPSTGAPKRALAALATKMHEDKLGYTSATGFTPLKARIALHYHEQYGIENLDPNRVIITFGASGAFILGFVGLFDPGARIAIPTPCYPSYLHMLEVFGLTAVDINTNAAQNFHPTVSDLEKVDEKIDGLLITSPSNPTGAMITAENFRALAEYCDDKGIKLISDEIYHGIVYQDKIPSITGLSLHPHIVVINSFSKYYSMPGWRLGWMVVPSYLVDTMSNLARNLYICPPAPSQIVALGAMDCRDELDKHVARYAKNRDIMLREMPKAGFDEFTSPDGAFYLYAHVADLCEDSLTFCMEMLEATGIAALPGLAFEPQYRHRYVRFSYAGATEDIEMAMERLQKWRAGKKCCF